MSSASRRHTRTGVRSRSVTRPHVEGLEARFAAGTVHRPVRLELGGTGRFRPAGRDPSFEGRDRRLRRGPTACGYTSVTFPGHFLVVRSDRAEEARRTPKFECRGFPDLFPGKRHRPRPALGRHQGPAEAAWDRMGTPDTPQRGATPTGPLAPRLGSAASGAAGNRFGNLGSGTLTAGSGGSAAGGGGVSASAVSGRGLGGAPVRGRWRPPRLRRRRPWRRRRRGGRRERRRCGRGRSKRRGQSAGNERARFPRSR